MGLFSKVKDAIGGAVSGLTGGGGSPWGAAIGAGLSLINSNSANAKAKRAAELANARNVYNMQHSYQWTMADMEAAGLNPILAAKNGANSVNSASAAQTFGADMVGGAATMMNAQTSSQLNSANAQLALANAAGKALENKWINKEMSQNLKESISRTLQNNQNILESQSRIGLNSAQKTESAERTKRIKYGKASEYFGTQGTENLDPEKNGSKLPSLW